jgi:hypothetical protein
VRSGYSPLDKTAQNPKGLPLSYCYFILGGWV